MIVDVSGYSYSGKGAVVDILRDFPALQVHKKEFEFLLIRATDGLLDLRSHIIDNPSEIRVDMAIKRFINLSKNLSSKPTSLFRPLSIFTPPGQDYSDLFPGFDEHTINFINNISSHTSEYWPFPSLYKSNFNSFLEKLFKLSKGDKNTKKYFSYISRDEFDNFLNIYLRKVLFSKISDKKTKVVTSNMLEVYSPNHFFEAIQPCKLIIVDRDPRGIFISIPGNKNDLENEKKVNEFIEKFKNQRSKKFLKNLKHENILTLKFEDIFRDFNSTLEKISMFLEEPIPKIFDNFSFEKSKLNVDSWKIHRNSKSIRTIENELAKYID
tara:strand:+ start:6063 stop:7037 length:975 start_codon:yes stop_codon:yes gene_type:complete